MASAAPTPLLRPKRATGRIETHVDRNERMGQSLRHTLESAHAYEDDPEAFESALDDLVVSLGTVGANLHSPDPSETLEPEPPERDDLQRLSLGRTLLWARPEGLPATMRGPLYDVVVSESRWRKLPKDLRAAVTYRMFKRDIVGRSAQYAYEHLKEARLEQARLDEFVAHMRAYLPAA